MGFVTPPAPEVRTYSARAKYRCALCLTVSELKHGGILSAIGRAYFQMLALFYMPLIFMALRFFECDEVESGDYVMAAAPAFSCYDSVYWKYFPGAVVCAIVYCVGIPTAASSSSWRRSSEFLPSANSMDE